jgi:hypothetical protein
MTNTISNTDDGIDSRDVIARIEELQCERDDLVAAVDVADDALEDCEDAEDRSVLTRAVDEARSALGTWDDGAEGKEFIALTALADEASGSDDWEYGATLVRDSYFVEYAQKLAEDCDMLPRNQDRRVSWPCSCIDWDEAASQLQQDYTTVNFGGVTYWTRG